MHIGGLGDPQRCSSPAGVGLAPPAPNLTPDSPRGAGLPAQGFHLPDYLLPRSRAGPPLASRLLEPQVYGPTSGGGGGAG
jgi:hypothetical protein